MKTAELRSLLAAAQRKPSLRTLTESFQHIPALLDRLEASEARVQKLEAALREQIAHHEWCLDEGGTEQHIKLAIEAARKALEESA